MAVVFEACNKVFGSQNGERPQILVRHKASKCVCTPDSIVARVLVPGRSSVTRLVYKEKVPLPHGLLRSNLSSCRGARTPHSA